MISWDHHQVLDTFRISAKEGGFSAAGHGFYPQRNSGSVLRSTVLCQPLVARGPPNRLVILPQGVHSPERCCVHCKSTGNIEDTDLSITLLGTNFNVTADVFFLVVLLRGSCWQSI